MKIHLILVIFIFPLLLQAQEKKANPPGLHLIGSVGLASGQSDAGAVAQLSAGRVRHHFYTGMGFGFDSYKFNSYPLFADLRFLFGDKIKGFLYTNPGYLFPGRPKKTDDEFKTTDQLSGGIYMDAGVGCSFRMAELHRIQFSLGYSYKSMKNTVGFVFPCLVGPCPEEIFHYKYGLGRIITRISWDFGH